MRGNGPFKRALPKLNNNLARRVALRHCRLRKCCVSRGGQGDGRAVTGQRPDIAYGSDTVVRHCRP
jgi:hypothetical protein